MSDRANRILVSIIMDYSMAIITITCLYSWREGIAAGIIIFGTK